MQISSLVALFSALTGVAVVNAEPEHVGQRGMNRHEAFAEKRAVCNRDNVLRALLANGATASSFCSSYINIPQVTIFSPGPTPFPTPVTTITFTITTTTISYPPAYSPYLVPTYLFSYPTPSRISSACSCLSVPPSTVTFTGIQPETTITSTATTTLTGACATETLYPGGYKLSSPGSTDAFEYTFGSVSIDGGISTCCGICNSVVPFLSPTNLVQGFFGNCIGWRVDANRVCTLLLQGSLGAGYLGPKCGAFGFEPGTISVNPKRYPFAVGGQGQCASTFTAVSG